MWIQPGTDPSSSEGMWMLSKANKLHATTPALQATQASMGDSWPWGGAGEELLGPTLFGTACHIPNRGCWQRIMAEAALHNVTKPH